MQAGKQPNPQAVPFRLSLRQRLWTGCAGLAIAALLSCLFLAQRSGYNVGGLFLPCGFKQRYGLPCPTCGMTTAVLAFTRAEVIRAFEIQPAAGLLCSALVLSAAVLLGVGLRGEVPGFLQRVWAHTRVTGLLIGLGLILAAGWLVTLWRAISG